MVNMKGGKGYKRGRHTETDLKGFEVKYDEGQMLGRVLKSLGNKRFRVYCNDNQERICKLAGSMRKSQWVDEGSLVLIGMRGMGTGYSTDLHEKDVGDILMVIPNSMASKLKKDPKANPAIFSNVDDQNVQETKRRVEAGGEEEDDLFEQNNSDEEETNEAKAKEAKEEDTSSSDADIPLTLEEKQAKEKEQAKKKKEKVKERDQKRASGRDAKRVQETNDTIDIDNI